MMQLTARQPQGPRTNAKGHIGKRMRFDRLCAHKGISALHSHFTYSSDNLWLCKTCPKPASLALSGDSISYSPTLSALHAGGRDTGWKMRSHSSASSRSSQGITHCSKGNSAVPGTYRPQTNWNPVPRRHRVTSWKFRQNLSAQLRAERSTYELNVKLLATHCQLKYAVAQARRRNSHGFPVAE